LWPKNARNKEQPGGYAHHLTAQLELEREPNRKREQNLQLYVGEREQPLEPASLEPLGHTISHSDAQQRQQPPQSSPATSTSQSGVANQPADRAQQSRQHHSAKAQQSVSEKLVPLVLHVIPVLAKQQQQLD